MGRNNERPEIVTYNPNEEFVFDDIPAHTKLKIVVKDNGEDSYVEYTREDGSIRRLFTLKGGGQLNIRTARE